MSQVFDESNSQSPNSKFAVSLPNLDQVLSPSKQMNNSSTAQQHSRLPAFFDKLIHRKNSMPLTYLSNVTIKDQKKESNILEHLDEYGLW